MDVEAMSKTNTHKALQREWRLNTERATLRYAAPSKQAYRIALQILAFDREIARISAYSRHKPFYPLGKVACGRGLP
jgi:hypothetical protein